MLNEQGVTASGECNRQSIGSFATNEQLVRFLVKARQVRTKFLGSDIYLADPVGDMLLHLYMSRAGSRPVIKSDLYTASGVPDTTALRWIRVMEDSGLIQSARDNSDRRLRLITLTPETVEAFDRYLDELRASL
jgi:DNA-binding MarR family transcriptional regulator